MASRPCTRPTCCCVLVWISETGFERTAAVIRLGVRGVVGCAWVVELVGAPSEARGAGGVAHPASTTANTRKPRWARTIKTLSSLLSAPTIVSGQYCVNGGVRRDLWVLLYAAPMMRCSRE